MIVKITEDLIIDPMEIYKVHKVGKDIYVYMKNKENFSMSVYEKEGKAFLKYFREYSNE